MSNSLQPHGLYTYSPWNSPGHNTGVGSRSLLQGIFPTLGSNPGLLHCRLILYQLSHQRSPYTHLTGHPLVSAGGWVQMISLNTRGLRNVFLILTKLMLSNGIQRVDWRSSIHSYCALLENYPWKIKNQARWLIGLHCLDPATEVLLLDKGLTWCRSVVPRVWKFVISCSEQLVCFTSRSW